MKNDFIVIASLIFFFPVIIIGVVINGFKHFVLGEEIKCAFEHQEKTDRQYKKRYYLFSFVVWAVIVGWAIYQNQFTYITIVYACPYDKVSKCYKVRADYVPEYCEGGEWDIRGWGGDYCDSSYIQKIYFTKSNYIAFDYCEENGKDKWFCYTEDYDVWEIQLAERFKV